MSGCRLRASALVGRLLPFAWRRIGYVHVHPRPAPAAGFVGPSASSCPPPPGHCRSPAGPFHGPALGLNAAVLSLPAPPRRPVHSVCQAGLHAATAARHRLLVAAACAGWRQVAEHLGRPAPPRPGRRSASSAPPVRVSPGCCGCRHPGCAPAQASTASSTASWRAPRRGCCAPPQARSRQRLLYAASASSRRPARQPRPRWRTADGAGQCQRLVEGRIAAGSSPACRCARPSRKAISGFDASASQRVAAGPGPAAGPATPSSPGPAPLRHCGSPGRCAIAVPHLLLHRLLLPHGGHGARTPKEKSAPGAP